MPSMYTIVVFLLSAVFFAAQATVNIDNGCALGVWTNSENAANYEIPQPTWLQTPSIAEISTGKIATHIQISRLRLLFWLLVCLFVFVCFCFKQNANYAAGRLTLRLRHVLLV